MKFYIFFSIIFHLNNLLIAQQALPEGCLDAFRSAALNSHNKFRSLHGASPLTESSAIDTSALTYAKQMAKSNDFAHSGNLEFGENIYETTWSLGGQNLDVSYCSQFGAECVASWYNEINLYDFSNQGEKIFKT